MSRIRGALSQMAATVSSVLASSAMFRRAAAHAGLAGGRRIEAAKNARMHHAFSRQMAVTASINRDHLQQSRPPGSIGKMKPAEVMKSRSPFLPAGIRPLFSGMGGTAFAAQASVCGASARCTWPSGQERAAVARPAPPATFTDQHTGIPWGPSRSPRFCTADQMGGQPADRRIPQCQISMIIMCLRLSFWCG